jgi:protein CpxP
MITFKNKRWLWLSVPLLAVVGSISVARAHGHGPFRFGHRAESAEQVREHMSRGTARLSALVDADDAQQKAIDAVVARTSPELFALMREGRTLRSQLKTALLAPTIDRAQVDALSAQLTALSARFVTLSSHSLLDVSDTLTPAQRQKLADKLSFFDE